MSRLVAAPHPFKVETIDRFVPDGMTLADTVEFAKIDPILAAHAHIWVGDQYIPRHLWARVRPKPGVTITLRVVPHGGGGGGSKNPLRTVLTIAVIAAAYYFGPALGASLGGLSTTAAASTTMVFGSLSYAALGSAIIAITGTLLVNVIAPIRPAALGNLSSAGGGALRDSPTLFIEGARNAVRPFAAVPAVLGVHRQVPPLGTKSYTEVVGEDNFIRILAVWGYGPLKIENIKIAETPIENFEGVQIETREGRSTDTPHTLIPETVIQEDFSILLSQAGDWQTRNANPNADELSVDITFANGLVQFNNEGQRTAYSVSAQIEYRLIGSDTWLTPTFTAKTVPDSWVSGNTITFTHNRTGAIRHGFRWKPAARGDYEIRIRRTSADTDSTQIFDIFGWTALRAIRNENPINFPYPLATTEMIIKATDQLNRIVDELNATVSSYVNDYQGSSVWSEAVSSNPASLFRHVLQGKANEKRLPDNRVDIETLEAWHDFCRINGFEFNMVRDFQASVWDTLADIAAAGRASPTQIDGKWSVVYDYQQSVPVQHFTPRNSWGFEAEKSFPDQPHGWRIRFNNREQGWRNDERIVYADGYTASNATTFLGLDAIGITNPAHVWKYGRFHLAQGLLRPERWTFNADFEHIVARRGKLVLITHDILSVGLKSGRIKQVVTGGSPLMVVGVVTDEKLNMVAGNNYGLSIRNVDNIEITKQIVTSDGDQTEITFTNPFPIGTIDDGDLFGFGLLGSETIRGLILTIEPQTDLSARIVCIPESAAIYTADSGSIPPFDSRLTPQALVPTAVIENVRSDESVLQLGSGNTLIPRVAIRVKPPATDRNVSLNVQIRMNATNEPYHNIGIATVEGNDYFLVGPEQDNIIDIRVRWNDPTRLPGPWTYIFNHRVIGQSTPPGGLINANIAVFGGQALIRWDKPTELDVRFGGVVRFRHTPETDASMATWQSSTSIGDAAKGDSLIASLPLKPGTYLARVFDKQGRPSIDVVKLSTKQASVLTFANVDTISESPSYVGTKEGTVLSDDSLYIASLGLFDDIPDLDAEPNLDFTGGIASEGTYNFAAGFDFDTVSKVRLTSVIDATSINILDKIDNRPTNIDTWENFDGTEQSAADCRILVRQTDDDPTGSPVNWSEWNYLDSGEFEARAFQFKAVLTTNDSAFNIRVDTLGVVAEILDI